MTKLHLTQKTLYVEIGFPIKGLGYYIICNCIRFVLQVVLIKNMILVKVSLFVKIVAKINYDHM